MQSNVFKKFCNSIDYNTYTNLQNSFGVSTIGLSLVNELIPQSPIVTTSLDVLGFALLATYLGLVWSDGREHTKDINQIRNLYMEFLKQYNKLNKTFDLNNPVEIYTMYNYLLYNGYLSANKEFEFSGVQTIDLNSLSGINVIAGNGVCRHISAMLIDILNSNGIKARQLGVYSKDYNINIKFLEEEKYSKEELVNWVRTHIVNEQTYQFIMQLVDELVDNQNKNIELSWNVVDDKNILKRKIGNHAITFAIKDGKNYFLDPTQTRIYRMKEADKGILYDDECDYIPIRFVSSIVLNKPKGYVELNKLLTDEYSSISIDEEQSMIDDTMNKCKSNIDVFEKFYVDNCELYNDVASKVLSIKKRKQNFK